jgi:uncharacterized repeat protein (TIGR01451 family)
MSLGLTSAFADTSATTNGALTITLSTIGPVLAGQAMTYAIIVSNPGVSPAQGILVYDQLPSGFRLATLPNPDVCGRTNKPLLPGTAFVCSVPDLPSGASESLSFTAIPSQVGLYTDTATVTGFVSGLWGTTSVSLPTQVDPGATDAQVTGSASTGSPARGATFTDTFQVKNSGPQVAYGLALTDTLPAELTLVGVTTDNGACVTAAATMSCNLGDFATGRQAVVVVTATAPTGPATIVNTATVSMSGPDTHPSNDSVNITIQVK